MPTLPSPSVVGGDIPTLLTTLLGIGSYTGSRILNPEVFWLLPGCVSPQELFPLAHMLSTQTRERIPVRPGLITGVSFQDVVSTLRKCRLQRESVGLREQKAGKGLA